MKKQIFLFIVLLVSICQSCTKVDVSTSVYPSSSAIKFYGDGNGNFLTSFEATADGNYMFGGYTFTSPKQGQQGFIQKCDHKGNVIWRHTYGGKYLDIFNAVHVTSDGGYIAAGTTTSIGVGFNDSSAHEDAYLAKMDANGDTIWQKSFGAAFDDRFYDVAETADHGFVAVGIFDSANINLTYVVKTDKEGNRVWERKLFPNAYESIGLGVTVAPNGDIAIAGYVVKSSVVADLGTHYPSFISLTSDGKNLNYKNAANPFPVYKTWGSVINTYFNNYATTSNLEKIVSRPDGYILVVNLEASGPNSVMMIKVDLKGNVIWNQQYFGLDGGFNYMNDISNNTEGGLLISGSTLDATGKNYCWLWNTDANGKILWQSTVPIAGYTAWAAGAVPNGNSFAVGVNLIATSSNHTVFFGLVNIDQNGKVVEINK